MTPQSKFTSLEEKNVFLDFLDIQLKVPSHYQDNTGKLNPINKRQFCLPEGNPKERA